jgi:hypothetical protein
MKTKYNKLINFDMKKYIASVVLLVIGLNINAQIIIIPDSNFKVYLLGNLLINTNNDSEIQLSEATSFTGGIGCENLNISNLSGIEAFTLLTDLNCYNNQLTSLDVSDCVNLVNLDCSSNQIGSLNLSSNTELVSLGCGRNNLTELDVSSNLNLEALTCRKNQIDSLSLSQNSTLSLLICNSNQLKYLNVANGNNTNFGYMDAFDNPDLYCIFVDDSIYSNQHWHQVDDIVTFHSGSTNCYLLSSNQVMFAENISIWPNPTNSTIRITGIDNLEVKNIKLINYFGQIVSEYKTIEKIDLSKFSTGVYVLQIETFSRGKIISKIIKN